MRGALVRLVLLPALLLGARASAGPPDSDSARAHYERATALFALERFADAAAEFEQAFELKPSAALLYNAAQAHRLAGNRLRALKLYRNCLRIYGAKAQNREEIEGHIAVLERALQEEVKTGIPKEPPANVPAEAPRRMDPAPAEPAPPARADRGSSAVPAAAIVATPAVERDPPLVRRPVFWAIAVGLVAVVATGIALGLVLGSSPSDPMATLGVVEGN